MTTLDTYPNVVIQEIAKRLDYNTIRMMKLVHSRFFAALSDLLMWIQLCERDNRTLPSFAFRKSLAEHVRKDDSRTAQLDFERIWAKDPFRSNVAPSVSHRMEGFCLVLAQWPVSNLGRISIKFPPIECEPHPEVTVCYPTRRIPCTRAYPMIDLVKEGIPEWLLDHVRPRIVVRELIARNQSDEYRMQVQLLLEGEEFSEFIPLSRKREPKLEKVVYRSGALAKWERVEVVFDNYPMGIRKIAVHIEHRSAVFANFQIRVEVPDNLRWISKDEVPDVTYQDCCGIQTLRTESNKYISAEGWKVRQSVQACQWLIEDHIGLVTLKPANGPCCLYLRAYGDERVRLVDECTRKTLWKMIENEDGSRSFLSFTNRFLSSVDGILSTMQQNSATEHFRLDLSLINKGKNKHVSSIR